MNYSTLAEGFAQDADGTIFDFGSLYERSQRAARFSQAPGPPL